MTLIDTNIVIYATRPDREWLRELIRQWVPAVSVITYLEAFGTPSIPVEERTQLERFFAMAKVLPLDQGVVEGVVQLRGKRRIKLPDAVIAATALVHGLTLVTRNLDDFRGIEGLDLLNPFANETTSGTASP